MPEWAVGAASLRDWHRNEREFSMRTRLVPFVALALIATVATLAIPPASAQTSLKAPAGGYTVYSNHTQVIFGIRHLGLSTFYGTFGHVTGSLQFDPAQPEKSALNVQIDMNDIVTPVDELNTGLKSFFQSAKYPT